MSLQDYLTKFLTYIPLLAPVIAGILLKRRQNQNKAAGTVPGLPHTPEVSDDGADVPTDDGIIVMDPDEAAAADPYQPCTCDRAQRYLHIIDNGHDQQQAGKRSPRDVYGKRFYEFEFNEDIRNRVVKRLKEEGVAYHVLVPDTSFRTLTGQRARMANALASDLPKLYHSIHANAGPADSLDDYTDPGVGGIEVWHAAGSTRGRRMAAITLRHLASVPLIVSQGIRNRGLRSKPTGQFTVLVDTDMPAQLTEAPFYNNYVELQLLKFDAFREQWAEAHVQAILEMERDGV